MTNRESGGQERGFSEVWSIPWCWDQDRCDFNVLGISLKVSLCWGGITCFIAAFGSSSFVLQSKVEVLLFFEDYHFLCLWLIIQFHCWILHLIFFVSFLPLKFIVGINYNHFIINYHIIAVWCHIKPLTISLSYKTHQVSVIICSVLIVADFSSQALFFFSNRFEGAFGLTVGLRSYPVSNP